ncbi:MAG: hypothetical protein ACOC2F_05660 [Bacteroidota bacterium]
MSSETRKITVKHYLNKRAKAKTFKKESFYPLYIQIIVTGKKAQIKSKINEHLKIYRSDIARFTNNENELSALVLDGYFSDRLLKDINDNARFPIHHLLEDEITVIKRIIKLQDPFHNPNFSLFNFSTEYHNHTAEITHVLDEEIKKLYRNELKNIFLRSIDEDENRNIFKVSNYLIHFVNWETSFSNFYEATYEIIPSEIRLIENLINKELRTTIKAYMAYLANVNILKRFFEKREQGKISTLSYLDWQTDIKDFILKQFEKVFGEQRALEYVISLDNLLTDSIRNEQATNGGLG